MGLSAGGYIALLRTEAAGLSLPAGPRRRTGPDQLYRSAFDAIRQDLHDQHDQNEKNDERAGAGPGPEARRADAERAMELASLLYAAGAPHPAWRRWAALTSVGLLLAADPAQAAVWAVLSRNHDLVARLPPAGAGTGRQPAGIVHLLATGVPDPRPAPPTPGATDGVDRAWSDLTRSIPAQDNPAIDAALRTIADFWIDEDDDGDETRFHPRSYPDFEPEVNAVATLAAAAGWTPTRLSEAERSFLDPGLAPGDSAPLPPAALPAPDPAGNRA